MLAPSTERVSDPAAAGRRENRVRLAGVTAQTLYCDRAPRRARAPMRTGFAHLPLHGGRAPAWLFGRMVRLSRELLGHVVAEHGPSEVLRRLSDPFWFQAFGCVLGFDWHSSGVTTTVCAAVKEAVRGNEADFG